MTISLLLLLVGCVHKHRLDLVLGRTINCRHVNNQVKYNIKIVVVNPVGHAIQYSILAARF